MDNERMEQYVRVKTECKRERLSKKSRGKGTEKRGQATPVSGLRNP